MQRAEQLPARALVAAARVPALEDVDLREGEVREEEDGRPEVRGAFRFGVGGGVGERGEDAAQGVRGDEAWMAMRCIEWARRGGWECGSL